MAITQSYIDGLTKQIFIRDYILNGAFPGQSDVVRGIIAEKRPWDFNHQFEYRMLLASSNTGGTLNSQIFNGDVSLQRPGSPDIGIFRATYGSVSDGFSVDMTANLETSNAKAAFLSDYANRVHSMRVNVAALFKNFAIHGRFGVLTRLSANVNSDNVRSAPTPATDMTPASLTAAAFTITTPVNVYHSGFKKGKILIKTTETFPWGAANANEAYMVLDNQPNHLTLVALPGTTPTAWAEGQYLEVAGNRTVTGGTIIWNSDGSMNTSTAGTYTSYTVSSGVATGAAGTGAMEGLADLFPWYVDGATGDDANATRANALALPFRAQPNRSYYSTEQAGGFYVQKTGESVIDAILNGTLLATGTVPQSDLHIWMNPVTRLAIGYEENDSVRVIREITSAGPVVFQRGVTETSYAIGSKVIPDTVSDFNIPTDIVVISPKRDISYNAWDNATMQIDRYIRETFSKENTPAPEKLTVPNDLVAKLDISNRITYGSPHLADGVSWTDASGSSTIVHPSNTLPIALHEMGALFTENPYAYTIVKLRRPIVQPSDVLNWT